MGAGGAAPGARGGARGGRPEPAAPGWELGPGRSPGRGRGGPGRGGRRVWDWGSGLGEGSGDRGRGGGRPAGAPPRIPGLTPRALGVWTRGDGGGRLGLGLPGRRVCRGRKVPGPHREAGSASASG